MKRLRDSWRGYRIGLANTCINRLDEGSTSLLCTWETTQEEVYIKNKTVSLDAPRHLWIRCIGIYMRLGSVKEKASIILLMLIYRFLTITLQEKIFLFLWTLMFVETSFVIWYNAGSGRWKRIICNMFFFQTAPYHNGGKGRWDKPHDDVIKWKHFPRYWSFVRGIHRSPVNSPHKGRWRGALMHSLICARTNGWVNNRDAGDLRRHRAYSDVTVMLQGND